MSTTFNQKHVEALKPRGSRYEVQDPLLPPLRIVVQPSGHKSWAIRYGKASAKMTLGSFALKIDGIDDVPPVLDGPLTLKGARQLARDQLQLLAAGYDPAQEKQKAKAKAAQPDDADLVRSVAAKFVDRYLLPRAKPGYAKSVQRILDKEYLPAWGGRRVQDITRRDVLDLLDAVVTRGAPKQANRVLAAGRKMFAWAASRDLITVSPFAGVKPPTPETPRQRALTDAELRLVWLAATEVGYPFGPAVKLLAVLGQRLAEVSEGRRSEFSEDGRTWSLSGGQTGRTKNRRGHVVPLSAFARSILEALPQVAVDKAEEPDVPRFKGVRDYLFTTTGKTPVSGFAHAKVAIDAAMLRIAKREALERREDPDEVEPIPHWVFHDLRRSTATGMARLRVRKEVVERALNHVSGAFSSVAGVYDVHTYEDEVREALQLWSDHVQAVVGDNVIPMPKKKAK